MTAPPAKRRDLTGELRRAALMRRVPVVLLGLSMLLGLLGAGIIIAARPPPYEPQPVLVSRSVPEPAAPAPRDVASLFQPPADAVPQVDLSAAVERLALRIETTGPLLPVDGITFQHENGLYRLAGIEGIAADAQCFAADGTRWGCALGARAALNNATRQLRVVCLAPRSAQARLRHVRCEVEGRDLAETLVSQGWARPLQPDDTRLAPLLAEAQRERRGIWRGQWPEVAPPMPRAAAPADDRPAAAATPVAP